MTLVREGSGEGETGVKGRRLGDRRYHRRSLGWLAAAMAAVAAAAVVAATTTTVVVVEWWREVDTGGK